MKRNPVTAVSTANKNGVLLLAAILPVFFVPYEKLLIATGFAAVATGIFVIINSEYLRGASNLFVSALAFFLMAVVCKQHPALMAAGVGMWMWRKAALLLFAESGHVFAFPFVAVVRLVAGFCSAAVLILWTGTYDFTLAFFASAIMALVAALADAVLNPKNHAPLAELAATLFAVSILGFHTANLVYLQNLWLALGGALVAAVFFYKTGLLEKAALWLFVACSVVIGISLGWPGWLLYFVSLLMRGAGWRSSKQNGAVQIPQKFAAHSFPATMFAALSAGWDTPFVFYFAFAGSLSALAFHDFYQVMAGASPDEPSYSGSVDIRRSFSRGIIGITIISACAVSSKFIPMGGLYILLLAGISPLTAPAFGGMLAKPGRDAVWLVPFLGAAVAAVSAKLL